MNSRKPLVLATTVALGTSLAIAAPAAQAEQAPKASASASTSAEQNAKIQSCFGTAKNYTSAPGGGGRNAHWPGTGRYAYATKNCGDINLKTNHTRQVTVCFKKTGKCNGWKTAKKGKWLVAAKGVRDGAGFYIQFKGPNKSTGKIAY
ncbi:hypothetical protein [Streptomyces sp. CB03238]|uniref:hypothetical protein n=1 Tax=Streptomyces sp. CB03238 TaxID=1907777 RepID=UPI000A118887|nr:hypothetical protein [Streptomyces sp. CB03238]ORT53967.1 hypothetical protein BKD26_36875 [Streptomyces sp. CB03238]